jgi:transposase-like protein
MAVRAGQAWRVFLDDPDARGLKVPDFVIGHAPKALHDELTEDYRDMVYGATKAEIEARRRAFLRKWRLKCKAVADSLEEAGHRLYTFTTFAKPPQDQCKSRRDHAASNCWRIRSWARR